VEVIDNNGNEVSPEFNSGLITVNGSGGNPGIITFSTTTETINNGDNVCLPI